MAACNLTRKERSIAGASKAWGFGHVAGWLVGGFSGVRVEVTSFVPQGGLRNVHHVRQRRRKPANTVKIDGSERGDKYEVSDTKYRGW